jgi:hypothetical protein
MKILSAIGNLVKDLFNNIVKFWKTDSVKPVDTVVAPKKRGRKKTTKKSTSRKKTK